MLSNSEINKVFLVGHIGQEPRWHSANGEPKLLCFSMVTTELIKKNGTSVEHIEWHQIKIPENFVEDEQALKKGQLVYVQGKMQTRHFTDEQQVKRYNTEILAQQVQVLSSTIGPDIITNAPISY